MPSRKPYPGDKDARPWMTIRLPREVGAWATKALYFAKIQGAASRVEQWESIFVDYCLAAEGILDELIEGAETPDLRFRLAVLERDGWECADCGTSKNLQVHHIITRNECRKSGRLALLTEPSNAITLCADCHGAVTGEERDHAPRFQQYVNQKIAESPLCGECRQ